MPGKNRTALVSVGIVGAVALAVACAHWLLSPTTPRGAEHADAAPAPRGAAGLGDALTLASGAALADPAQEPWTLKLLREEAEHDETMATILRYIEENYPGGLNLDAPPPEGDLIAQIRWINRRLHKEDVPAFMDSLVDLMIEAEHLSVETRMEGLEIAASAFARLDDYPSARQARRAIAEMAPDGVWKIAALDFLASSRGATPESSLRDWEELIATVDRLRQAGVELSPHVTDMERGAYFYSMLISSQQVRPADAIAYGRELVSRPDFHEAPRARIIDKRFFADTIAHAGRAEEAVAYIEEAVLEAEAEYRRENPEDELSARRRIVQIQDWEMGDPRHVEALVELWNDDRYVGTDLHYQVGFEAFRSAYYANRAAEALELGEQVREAVDLWVRDGGAEPPDFMPEFERLMSAVRSYLERYPQAGAR